MSKPSGKKFVWGDDDFEIVEVKKYNESHDERGRFDSGDGAGGGAGARDGDPRLGAANWVKPDEKSLKQEYMVEYQHHFKYSHGDVFPAEADFLNAIREAPVVTVDRDFDRKISGRSRSGSMGSLLSLISGYRSYPQYRNEKTLAALEERIKSGKPTDLPIVTNDRGHMQVFSGNTRMDIGFMHAPAVKVIMLDVGKYRKIDIRRGDATP